MIGPIFDRRSAGWLAPFQVLFTRPTWQRLVLHTAAYWLMLTVRDAIPAAHPLARAEFATIRLRLLKLGARIRETAARVRLASPSPRQVPRQTCCATLRPRSSQHRPERRGCDAPTNPLLSLNHQRNVLKPHASEQTPDPARRHPKTRRQPSPGE